MNIKEASLLTGISRDMLRHYEKLGLLLPARNVKNQYRDYSVPELNNAVMIRQYSSLGVSLRSLEKFLHRGDTQDARGELEQTISRLEQDLEWTGARLKNARDYAYLFSLMEKGPVSDTGVCPVTYYYPRPENGMGFAYTDPGMNGAVRMVSRIAKENAGLSEFPTDQGILLIRRIDNYPFSWEEIPAHRYWRTVIEEEEGFMNGVKLQPVLRQMEEAGYILQGSILLYQLMGPGVSSPARLVCVECDIGPV